MTLEPQPVQLAARGLGCAQVAPSEGPSTVDQLLLRVLLSFRMTFLQLVVLLMSLSVLLVLSLMMSLSLLLSLVLVLSLWVVLSLLVVQVLVVLLLFLLLLRRLTGILDCVWTAF